jgi:hypothetical protein
MLGVPNSDSQLIRAVTSKCGLLAKITPAESAFADGRGMSLCCVVVELGGIMLDQSIGLHVAEGDVEPLAIDGQDGHDGVGRGGSDVLVCDDAPLAVALFSFPLDICALDLSLG